MQLDQDMNTIYVSFWDITLDNFPAGAFTHRELTAHTKLKT
jgi:hypothetical protein